MPGLAPLKPAHQATQSYYGLCKPTASKPNTRPRALGFPEPLPPQFGAGTGFLTTPSKGKLTP